MIQKHIEMTTRVGSLALIAGVFLNWVLDGYDFGKWLNLLLPTVAFWLIVTGVLLVFAGMRKRMGESGLRRRLEAALALSAPLACLYAVLSLGIQFGSKGVGAFGNCQKLTDVVVSSTNVPESKSQPGRPAVDCMTARYGIFLTRYTYLVVYGIQDRQAQNRVLLNLSRFHRDAHTEPLRVAFLKEEAWSWQAGTNGVRIGKRRPEMVLRTVTLR